jgi:hypothetical protein
METVKKVCCRCSKSLNLEEFTPGKGWCRPCHAKRAKEWRLANVERNRAIQKQNYERKKLKNQN